MYYKNSTNGNCAANAANENRGHGWPTRRVQLPAAAYSIAWQIVLMAKKAGPPDDAKVNGSEEAARATRAGRCSPQRRSRAASAAAHFNESEGDPPDDARGCSDIFPPVFTQIPRASIWGRSCPLRLGEGLAGFTLTHCG